MSRQAVILLHGLARHARSMNKMAAKLNQEGYCIVNCDYPSRSYPIETLAQTFIPEAIKSCQQQFQAEKIHFVTHSMGGILLRYYLNHHKINQLGRIVMLAPPNQGCEIVDKLEHWRLFKWINGEAGLQLGTGRQSLPKQLGRLEDYELGIIAGNKSFNPFLNALLPEKNDGKVTISSTQLKGMSDFIVLPVTHSFMMNHSQVIKQTLYFLKQAHFAT